MYYSLYNSKVLKRNNAASVQTAMEDGIGITTHNTTMAAVLDNKRRKTCSPLPTPQRLLNRSISTVSSLHTLQGTNTMVTAEGSRGGASGSASKNYLQFKAHDGTNASFESTLTMAIADMIHSCGLPFSLASNAKYRRVLKLSRSVPDLYRPPGRNQLATELLDINYETYMKANIKRLEDDVDLYCLTFYGDDATVRKMPLINILASVGHLHTAVMEIVDATEQVQCGGKKDARYLASLFCPHLDSFENDHPNCVDYCTFDGAGLVQKAGMILNARYPRVFVSHGAEHVVSLFLQDCFNLPIVRTLHKIERKAYALFGSGSHYSPYAIFQKYCKLQNGGQSIGLFGPASKRMAGAAIALMRAFKLRHAFVNTINSHEFTSLKIKSPILNVLTSKRLWRHIGALCKAFENAIFLLRLADHATPAMGKLYFVVWKMDRSMLQAKVVLDDMKKIISAERGATVETRMVTYYLGTIGNKVYAACEEIEKDDDNDVNKDEVSLASEEDESALPDDLLESKSEELPHQSEDLEGDGLITFWNQRRKKLRHKMAVAGWM